MPTVFTPNGDNLNPLFEPKSISDGMKLLSIEVFTYGGEPVYFGDESPEFWQGRKMNGDEAQIGLYAYSISFKCLDGNVVTKQGNVQLNR
ncbi:MAG: gliding motility-associated C-terminal domain-containing protein, partial [Flavobacteriales bacterium]|nr:gliding motility-associated C-terminal domain-containing protein [Flavobacteriales bacterium]